MADESTGGIWHRAPEHGQHSDHRFLDVSLGVRGDVLVVEQPTEVVLNAFEAGDGLFAVVLGHCSGSPRRSNPDSVFTNSARSFWASSGQSRSYSGLLQRRSTSRP